MIIYQDGEMYVIPRKWLDEHDKQIREKFIDDQASLLAFICKKYNIPLLDMNCTVDEWEELKEQDK